MRKIDAAELKRMLDEDQELVLINVLDAGAFDEEHIPGSHNVPSNRLDLPRKVAELAGGKDRQVVVYCSNEACQASSHAGQRLEKSGFINVGHFEGGMQAWKRAGYPVHGGAGAPS
ncbi:MAG: rhodanese-like domain-containing protein [Longimicrobiales bacterium]